MRNELIERQKSETTRLSALLEIVELELDELEADALKDTHLWLLAKLIFEEKTLKGMFTMNKASVKALEKKLDRKNSELLEVRDFRKKLDDKEKQICAEIVNLQNQKIELIFAEIKKEVQTANLDVSSASILPILDALRKNQGVMDLLQPVAEPPVTDNAATSQAPPADFSTLDSLGSISEIDAGRQ